MARRVENSDSTPVLSIAGYLVSFSLQEMIMSAPLWAIDEAMNGVPTNMMEDLELIWTDAEDGGYVPDGDLRFYWHAAGALLLADERGRVDVGSHDLNLVEYFERFGLYDIR